MPTGKHNSYSVLPLAGLPFPAFWLDYLWLWSLLSYPLTVHPFLFHESFLHLLSLLCYLSNMMSTMKRAVMLQAADMSYLWLKEIHLENTLGSHSHPLIHSVPWLLANHALVYTHQRHTEVNDTVLQALPAASVQMHHARQCKCNGWYSIVDHF